MSGFLFDWFDALCSYFKPIGDLEGSGRAGEGRQPEVPHPPIISAHCFMLLSFLEEGGKKNHTEKKYQSRNFGTAVAVEGLSSWSARELSPLAHTMWPGSLQVPPVVAAAEGDCLESRC